jgi:hypothetical protein
MGWAGSRIPASRPLGKIAKAMNFPPEVQFEEGVGKAYRGTRSKGGQSAPSGVDRGD